jgi:hypothetical protein
LLEVCFGKFARIDLPTLDHGKLSSALYSFECLSNVDINGNFSNFYAAPLAASAQAMPGMISEISFDQLHLSTNLFSLETNTDNV